MNWKLKSALSVSALLLVTQAMAQITFYEGEGFRGRDFTTKKPVNSLSRSGFNDRASSAVVESGRWEVCEHDRYKGRCVVLVHGRYDSLTWIGLNDRISSVRPASKHSRYEEVPAPKNAQGMPQITFYEAEGYRGRAFTTEKPVSNFVRSGFNDRASSAVVESGRWEVCEHDRYEGRCVMLRPGSYDSLIRMGMNDRISSVRPASKNSRYEEAPAPLAEPNYNYRRRPNERVFEARVTSVHAVVGPPEQRCWVEHQQVAEPARSDRNVGGAVVGALLGGVLGHQVGGGRGQDLATVGGAVAGGLIGSNVGRNTTGGTAVRDVQRCENTPSSTPEFWDVTYDFRGVEHRVQMSAAPGPTISVNQDGEPRQ